MRRFKYKHSRYRTRRSPLTVVAVPQPLPLPGQLKPLDAEPARPPDRISRPARARDAGQSGSARTHPRARAISTRFRSGPTAEGALYQVFASPGRVTDIVLQEGEELVTVSAGDTVRWIVGDTTSASGAAQRVHVLVKPVRANLKTNLVITTSRRIYLLELTATAETWMASVSWDYPRDRLTALKNQAQRAEAAAPLAAGHCAGAVELPLRNHRRYAVVATAARVRRWRARLHPVSAGHRPRRVAAGFRGRHQAVRPNSSTTATARRTTSSIGCSARPNCAWAARRRKWCASAAPTASSAAAIHDRTEGRSGDAGTARAAAAGHAPESPHADTRRRRAGCGGAGCDLVVAASGSAHARENCQRSCTMSSASLAPKAWTNCRRTTRSCRHAQLRTDVTRTARTRQLRYRGISAARSCAPNGRAICSTPAPRRSGDIATRRSARGCGARRADQPPARSRGGSEGAAVLSREQPQRRSARFRFARSYRAAANNSRVADCCEQCNG